MEKTCKECGITKPAKDFAKQVRKCRECTNKHNRNQYAQRREFHSERKKKYAKEHPVEVAQVRLRASIRWNKKNMDKRSVYNRLVVAVRSGRILKQPCEVCGEIKVDGHHDDYTKPLEVRWLCRKHHKEHHKKEKDAQRAKEVNIVS